MSKLNGPRVIDLGIVVRMIRFCFVYSPDPVHVQGFVEAIQLDFEAGFGYEGPSPSLLAILAEASTQQRLLPTRSSLPSPLVEPEFVGCVVTHDGTVCDMDLE
ncbi:MAG: hypothetical protein KDD66_06870 [Bdellovibrionales bacterium]|nr:hypothetical protein [Bdellovibrionales bacterium]